MKMMLPYFWDHLKQGYAELSIMALKLLMKSSNNSLPEFSALVNDEYICILRVNKIQLFLNERFNGFLLGIYVRK